MKNFRNILLMILAFMVFNLGAGAGVIHVCSAYCKMQACSSSHTHNKNADCCNHSDNDADDFSSAVRGDCACINVHYNIDYFFKVSQEDDAISFMPISFDLHEQIAYCFQPVLSGIISSQHSNAPPVYYDGRSVLAFHSVLII